MRRRGFGILKMLIRFEHSKVAQNDEVVLPTRRKQPETQRWFIGVRPIGAWVPSCVKTLPLPAFSR